MTTRGSEQQSRATNVATRDQRRAYLRVRDGGLGRDSAQLCGSQVLQLAAEVAERSTLSL